MIVYYLVYAILLFIYCEEKMRDSANRKKMLSVTFFIVFSIILGCRHPSM